MAISRRFFTLPLLADDDARIEWLKARLAEVEDEIVYGKTITRASAGDTSGENELDPNLDARTRRRMLLNDLAILDPDNFDREAAIKRTVPRYL